MKTFLIYIIAVVFTLGSITSCEKEENVSYDQLPDQSKNLIETYFTATPVTSVSRDKDDILYEVKLSDGTKIEFNDNGDWDEIDANDHPLPQDVLNLLPESIGKYLATNYPGFSVFKIDKESNMYELELNDGTELQFGLDGTFLRVDENGTGLPDNSYTSSNYEALPQSAKDFLGTHYTGVKVLIVTYEKYDSTPYEVRLEGGTEIDFDANGLWIDIDSNNKTIPASITSLLPTGITNYVTTHYPGNLIASIDKEPEMIKIELSNDLELQFKPSGEFIRIDD